MEGWIASTPQGGSGHVVWCHYVAVNNSADVGMCVCVLELASKGNASFVADSKFPTLHFVLCWKETATFPNTWQTRMVCAGAALLPASAARSQLASQPQAAQRAPRAGRASGRAQGAASWPGCPGRFQTKFNETSVLLLTGKQLRVFKADRYHVLFFHALMFCFKQGESNVFCFSTLHLIEAKKITH